MLAATYLVKNEIDIIEQNIRFHHNLGVSSFAVMDNGSTDGTRELLESLSKSIPIHIVDKPEQTYQFHRWRKEIVDICRKKFNPDRVICTDPDEFWLPNNLDQSLSTLLSRKEAILTIDRFNMLPALEMEKTFYKSDLKVVRPISYSKKTQQNESTNIAILLSVISPKVAVKPRGLLKLNGGNHRSKHLQFWSHACCDSLSVIHFPIRSYSQFERNVSNRASIINNNDGNIRIGDHYRRWAKLWEAGKLQNEYQDFFFDEEGLKSLIRIGVIEQDSYPEKSIEKVLRAAAA